jgi:glycosyltransferase involved in cell wall biosynthesis
MLAISRLKQTCVNEMDSTLNKCAAVSLVVATVGRVAELGRMLTSLAAQTWRQFEVIIVDQNADNRVDVLLLTLQLPFTLIHARSALGASKARNIGIDLASGEIIGFPDDDCWYTPNFLAEVKHWFDHNTQYDFFSCRILDNNHQEIASRWLTHSAELTRLLVLRACACSSLFFRKGALAKNGGFDKILGPGPDTLVKSAEEIDLVLRLMGGGCHGWYEKNLFIYHPCKEVESASRDRAFTYGVGFGFIMRKHHYPFYTFLYHIIRPVGGMARSFCLASPRAILFYWRSAMGRTIGYFFVR